MRSKKKRISLSDLEQEGGLNNDSSYALSKTSSLPKKIAPKVRDKSNLSFRTIKNSNETYEASPYEESLYEVDRNILASGWGEFKSAVSKLLKNKWFRRFHLLLEFVYIVLVLFYLFFLLEIENDNSIVLLTLMLVFLFFCLIVYFLYLVDNWRDWEIILDIILILFAISADIFEITQRESDKGYNSGGQKFLLNVARAIRGLMLQRRAANFIAEMTSSHQSKKMIGRLKRKKSSKDVLKEILIYLGKDERWLSSNFSKLSKKKRNNSSNYASVKGSKSKSRSGNKDGGESDRFGYNHHERMDEAEELDR